jgi:hypothetical protein
MSIETALPVATGKLLQVLYRVHIGTATRAIRAVLQLRPLRPLGILDGGAGSARVNGWIDHGRPGRLRPAEGDSVDYETW